MKRDDRRFTAVLLFSHQIYYCDLLSSRPNDLGVELLSLPSDNAFNQNTVPKTLLQSPLVFGRERRANTAVGRGPRTDCVGQEY